MQSDESIYEQFLSEKSFDGITNIWQKVMKVFVETPAPCETMLSIIICYETKVLCYLYSYITYSIIPICILTYVVHEYCQ